MANQIGIVTASTLNLRPQPSTKKQPIGILKRGTNVEIIGRRGDWYRVKKGNLDGYVSKKYLKIKKSKVRKQLKKGKVTASRLNVRAGPSTRKATTGQLQRGATVEILGRKDGWYRIKAGDIAGYVYGDFISIQNSKPTAKYLFEDATLTSIILEPPENEKYIIRQELSARQKRAARTWNSQGNLLRVLSEIIDIEPASVVAVLCVEAGGRGFGPDGHMIIRFENHVFWRQWGKRNTNTYNKHFRYNRDKPWLRHQFRPTVSGRWRDFHGKQANEWQVFELARNLNAAAAMRSISMGGPQIMGFNHARIGYDAVGEMFDNFQADIRFQILGLFDFLRGPESTSSMIEALQRKQFDKFASYYNGPGQAAKYGGWIGQYYDEFKQLSA